LVIAAIASVMPSSCSIARCSCVRHRTVVRRHDDQRELLGRDTGDHVVDEPLMARDIDETDPVTAISAYAKPRSIVKPRRFSSARLSVDAVGARTRACFPWSTWPAR
jgi:hypothetical protein